jgi:hypothetical protein
VNLNGYDNLKKTTERDTGTDIFTLVRVSHIHLFGLTFIFFIMGFVFSHAYVRPVWLKCTVIALPFFAIALDVSSWYFTKLFSSIRLGRDGCRGGAGPVLRVHVGGVHVPDVVLADPCRSRRAVGQRSRHRLTGKHAS